MNQVPQTDLAWLAGIVDGEGTVGLSRTNSKSLPVPYLRPHFQIANTDLRILNHAADIVCAVTGKRVSKFVVTNKGIKNQRIGYRLAVHTQWEMLLLLPALIPHLVAKKEQAQLAFEFSARRRGRNSYSWYEFKEADEAAYTRCLNLNRRGSPTENVVELIPRSA